MNSNNLHNNNLFIQPPSINMWMNECERLSSNQTLPLGSLWSQQQQQQKLPACHQTIARPVPTHGRTGIMAKDGIPDDYVCSCCNGREGRHYIGDCPQRIREQERGVYRGKKASANVFICESCSCLWMVTGAQLDSAQRCVQCGDSNNRKRMYCSVKRACQFVQEYLP